MVLRTLFALSSLVVLALATSPAEAAVLKCKAKDGTITYTQTTCPPGTTNADFPEDWNPNNSASTGGNTARSGAQPSSSRAIMYREAAYNCAKSEDEHSESCGVIDDAVEFCQPSQNHGSEVCVALREGLQAARDELNMSNDASRRRLRQLCAQGQQVACNYVDCPLDLLVKGSDEQVRACASQAKLPATDKWVKIDGNRAASDSNSTGKYVCLKKLERVNAIGERLTYREVITVVSFGGSHTASSLPGESFGSAHAAATAGCEAKTNPKKPEAPKPPPKKGGQAV